MVRDDDGGGGDFQVTPAHLTEHATAVGGVTDEVGLAARAVEAVHFDNDAYGLFCQALPAMMEPLKEIIYHALGGSVDNLTEVGDKLRLASSGYTDADTGVAGRMDGL